MSDFKDKCGDVLTGAATGAAAGGSIGAAIGIFAAPVTSTLGATIGGAIGCLAGLLSDQVSIEIQHIMIFLSDVADMETANMEADDRDNVFIICMPEEGG